MAVSLKENNWLSVLFFCTILIPSGVVCIAGNAKTLLVQQTKTAKIYHLPIKYTNLPQNIPNGSKMYQMAKK
jgi:hypothetical protein